MVGSLFIDFRKAFDVVDHSILLHKLALYKLNDSSLEWFKSYLTHRKQAVNSDTGLSEFTEVRYGVPQGSILGTTLFIFFINDLPLFMNFCFSDLYADDAIFHTHNDTLSSVEYFLQTEGNNAMTWGRQNKMHVHFCKTTCMAMGTRHKLQNFLNLKIEGNDIKNVSQQKLMGLTIDDKLT